MLFARLYAMPLLISGLLLVTGKGMGSPGLTRAASRDLQDIQIGFIASTEALEQLMLLASAKTMCEQVTSQYQLAAMWPTLYIPCVYQTASDYTRQQVTETGTDTVPDYAVNGVMMCCVA